MSFTKPIWSISFCFCYSAWVQAKKGENFFYRLVQEALKVPYQRIQKQKNLLQPEIHAFLWCHRKILRNGKLQLFNLTILLSSVKHKFIVILRLLYTWPKRKFISRLSAILAWNYPDIWWKYPWILNVEMARISG